MERFLGSWNEQTVTLEFDYRPGESSHPAQQALAVLELLQACLQSALGHELHNRLVAVQGLAQVLLLEQAERLDDEGRDYLTRLATGVRQADVMVRSLDELGRLLRDPGSVNPLDLAEVVLEAGGAGESVVSRPGHRVRSDSPLARPDHGAPALASRPGAAVPPTGRASRHQPNLPDSSTWANLDRGRRDQRRGARAGAGPGEPDPAVRAVQPGLLRAEALSGPTDRGQLDRPTADRLAGRCRERAFSFRCAGLGPPRDQPRPSDRPQPVFRINRHGFAATVSDRGRGRRRPADPQEPGAGRPSGHLLPDRRRRPDRARPDLFRPGPPRPATARHERPGPAGTCSAARASACRC